MTHVFHPTLLREYDIRGVVGDTLAAADSVSPTTPRMSYSRSNVGWNS